MNLQTEFVKKMNLVGPLILAPLGGGPGTPELTASAANAGALGSIGGAYFTAADLEANILKTRELTSKPLAVNLFIPSKAPTPDPAAIKKAIQSTAAYRAELKLSAPPIKASPFEDFSKLMEVIFRQKPAALSFVFGLLEPEYVQESKKLGIYLMGTATNPEEAERLRASGVDAIIAQGKEAGGHRGMFSPQQADSDLTTEQLTKSLIPLGLPIIAAGGLMDGSDIRRALSWGAQAAQLGTAFLLCPEAGTSKAYRQALLHRQGAETKLTRVFSGRLARGLKNRFMLEMDLKEEGLLPWPAQNAFTRDLRQKSAQTGSSEFLSLWAGEGISRIREMPARALVELLFKETLS
jgi:nitronate monooxygenase